MNIPGKVCVILLLNILLGIAAVAAEPVRTVRVGFFHFEGYHEIGADGRKSGYGYEYLQNLRKYTGWDFEYVGYGKSWAEMLDLLERGEIDLLTSATKTPEREKKFDFSASPIGNAAVIMTVKAGNSRYFPGDYRNWNGIRVGLLRNNTKNSRFDSFARAKGFRYVPVWFDDVARMESALQKKGAVIDALVAGSLRRLHNEWVYEQLDVQPFYAIVKKGNTALLKELDDAIEQLRVDFPALPDRLHDKYYSNTANTDVLFSASERAFIRDVNASGQVFRVLVNPDRPPFSCFRNGELCGIFRKIADHVSKRSGLAFEFVKTADRHEYYKAAARNDIDLILDLRHDYSYAEGIGCVLTEPYFSAVVSRLRRRNFTGKPHSVALVSDSDVAASALQYGLDGMTPFFYDDSQEVINAVKSGKQDSGMVYTRTAEKAIADDEFGNLTFEVVGGLVTRYAVGVKRGRDPRLISILDKTVRSLSRNDIDKLVMEHMVIPRRAFTLRALVMENPVLSFGILGLVLLTVLIFSGLFWMVKRKLWRYGNIVSKLPLRFLVVDAEGNILAGSSGNDRPLSGTGVLRKTADLPDRVQSLVEEKTREVLNTGKSGVIDFEFNGQKRTAEITPLPANMFPVPAVIWISMDTGELQAAREEALFNAERFRLTLQSIGDGVMVTDEEGNVTMLNNVAEQLTGWQTHEAAGRRHEEVFEIRSYVDDAPVVSPVRKALSTGQIVTLANHTDLIARSGRRYHIADSAAPIRDRTERIIGVILVFRDVTSEYAARDRLRGALTSLEYATELTDSAAFLFDPATRKMTGSKILPKLWGISGDGVAVSMRSWVCREDRRTLLEAWKELASGKVDVMTAEYRSDQSGAPRHYRIRASADRSNPRAVRFVGVIQDITEIVRSAGRLKGQQTLWEKVINAIPVMFFAKDAADSFRYILCNRAFAAFLGKTPEEVVGRTDSELFSVPGEVEFFLEKDRKVMGMLEGDRFEEDATDCNGLSHHIRTVKQPLVMPDGRRLLLGTCSDISELNRLIISERINSEVLSRAVVEVDFDRVLENVAGTLQEYTNCDRIILARCNMEGKLRISREWLLGDTRSLRDAGLEEHYRLWDKHLHIMQENRALVIPDISTHEITSGLVRGGNYQTSSLIVVPISIDDKLWGALFAAYSSRKHGFTENDERLMRSCSNVIALAEIRNRQKQAIERANFQQQMIFNNIRIPLWLYDGEGELLRINNAVCRLAGIPAGQLTTQRNREIFCSEMTVRPVAEVIDRKQPVRREVSFRGRKYLVNVEPIFDEAGKLIYIVKSAVDVTELDALLKNQQVVNFCLETLLGGGDMDSAIRSALEAVCRHLGSNRSYIVRFDTEHKTMDCFVEYVAAGREPVFKNIGSLPYSSHPSWEERFRNDSGIVIENVQEADAGVIGPLWKKTIQQNRVHAIYAKRLRLDSRIWGYLGLAFDAPRRFSRHDDQFIGSVAHFVELMLERGRAQKQILDALKEAQEASKAKSYFLATMSHEIRTPLNAVIGFSELLKGGGLSAKEQMEYLDSINLAGNSLLRLINDVLDLSKLEAEQTVLTPQPTNIMELLHEIEAIFQYKVQEKKLFYRLDCPAALPTVKVDSLRLRQILLNLIGNAVKFTRRGGITLMVRFEPGRDLRRGTLSIQVHDTGIGITEEAQRRIFEPFVQSDTIRDTHVYGGTGLGLAICRRLAERMNGKITLESEVGKGSSFALRLENIELAEGENSCPVSLLPPPEAGKSRVLLVDDVPMNLRVLEAMLRKLDMESVCAVSGKEALDIMRNDSGFSLVLTDLWMPGMNGSELAKQIHENPATAHLPILIVTADAQAVPDNSGAYQGILLKPITVESLRKAISDIDGSAGENPAES